MNIGEDSSTLVAGSSEDDETTVLPVGATDSEVICLATSSVPCHDNSVDAASQLVSMLSFSRKLVAQWGCMLTPFFPLAAAATLLVHEKAVAGSDAHVCCGRMKRVMRIWEPRPRMRRGGTAMQRQAPSRMKPGGQMAPRSRTHQGCSPSPCCPALNGTTWPTWMPSR